MKPLALILFLVASIAAVAYFVPRERLPEFGVQEYHAPHASVIAEKLARSATATIVFTGDVMLGRHVETLSSQNGEDYPFEHLNSLLQDPDLAVINLEGPVLEKHVPTPSQGFSFSFASTTPALLRRQGVDIASIANNHTGDKGPNGYADTIRYLKAAGIDPVGHPNLISSSSSVLRRNIEGTQVAFVSFNFTNPNFDTKQAASLVRSLRSATSTQKPDFVVAMIHGGTEYDLKSNAAQQSFYRSLIDAGSDLVIAHHPHVVQEVELYNGKPIFYSLGNFIFDQYFSDDVQKGLAVRLTLTEGRAEYELVPIAIKRSQPEVMDEINKEVFLNDLSKRSPTLAAEVKAGTFDVAR